MDATVFNYDTLAQRLRELAFLNKGLTIKLTDERVDPLVLLRSKGRAVGAHAVLM